MLKLKVFKMDIIEKEGGISAQLVISFTLTISFGQINFSKFWTWALAIVLL